MDGDGLTALAHVFNPQQNGFAGVCSPIDSPWL
jgi:hypothetical protein